MAYAVTLVFGGVGEDQYWSVNEKLGIARDGTGEYPAGLLVHAGGPAGGDWIVTEVWDAKATQEAFMHEHLGQALQAAGIGAPAQVVEADTVNLQLLG